MNDLELEHLRRKLVAAESTIAKKDAEFKQLDGVLEEVGGVAVSCINPAEDLRRALVNLKERAQSAESLALYHRNRADKFWARLCETVEALGKVPPEAAPYAKEWARQRMQELHAARQLVIELPVGIRQLGAKIPCNTGGTFENDPPDAILDAAIRHLGILDSVVSAAQGIIGSAKLVMGDKKSQ